METLDKVWYNIDEERKEGECARKRRDRHLGSLKRESPSNLELKTEMSGMVLFLGVNRFHLLPKAGAWVRKTVCSKLTSVPIKRRSIGGSSWKPVGQRAQALGSGMKNHCLRRASKEGWEYQKIA